MLWWSQPSDRDTPGQLLQALQAELAFLGIDGPDPAWAKVLVIVALIAVFGGAVEAVRRGTRQSS